MDVQPDELRLDLLCDRDNFIFSLAKFTREEVGVEGVAA
ncbi:23S rRNA 5-methyluridine methyltransferase [Yersinia kristensenii ATCC 33638]|nr:23S rRNA 5-methyluridine methyltransferase [Yersinia kristensenii ATCC 33638]